MTTLDEPTQADLELEQVADVRPRVQRDVLFTETPDGVLFHNASGGFHLASGSAYRFACLVVPHLDGRSTVAELCGGLGEAHRTMLVTLVTTLLRRGLARDVAVSGDLVLPDAAATAFFADQLHYVDHYVDGAAERFQRFRDSRIVVLGDDDVARWCVLSLVRNGAGRLQASAATVAAEPVCEALVDLAARGVRSEVGALPETDALWGWPDLAEPAVVVVTGRRAGAQVHHLASTGIPDGVRVLPAWTVGDRSIIGPLVSSADPTTWASAVRALGRTDRSGEAAVWEQLALGPVGPPGAGVAIEGPLAAMVGNHLAYEVFRILTGCLAAETEDGLIIQDVDSLDVVAETLLPDPSLPGTRPAPPPAAWSLVEPGYDATAHQGAGADDPVAIELNRRAVLVQRHCGLIAEFDDDEWIQAPLKISSALLLGRVGEERLLTADVDHVAGARLRLLDRVALDHARGALRPPDRGRDLASATECPAPALDAGAGHGAGPDLGVAAVRALRSAVAQRAVLEAVRGSVARRLDLAGSLPVEERPGDAASKVRFLLRSAELLGIELEALGITAPADAAPVVLVRAPSHRDLHAVACGLSEHAAAVEAMSAVIGTVQARRDVPTGERAAITAVEPIIPGLDPWTLAVGSERLSGEPPGCWEETVRRLAHVGMRPVAVRTTTAALARAGVETAAVVLVDELLG